MWLTALGPASHRYDNEDPELTGWFASTELPAVSFHQQSAEQGGGFYVAEDPPPGDLIATVGTSLDLLDVDRPPRDQVEEAPRYTVDKVLRHLP